MRGYLGRPGKTAEGLHDGWYTTGDVAIMEDDGFPHHHRSPLTLQQVPHVRIEEKLHELADITEQVFTVTSLPDDKKGERIMVVTTLADSKLAPVLEKLAQTDLPALWKPKTNQFIYAEALPLLGTGKLDLRGIRNLAAFRTTEVEDLSQFQRGAIGQSS
jgi:acyl-[acyl-carrier-protein]-phospholipid O-acyltransferase / long-chain-fatty-acid--[acyl-carrier-protein] ligase